MEIFDSGPDVEVATVEAQKTFAEAWFDQFRIRMTATLRQKKWLLREWDVTTPAGEFIVRYSGRGHGYESIAVNGAVVAKIRSPIWFIPKFEFNLGDLPASVEVRVWPWLLLRAVRLRVAEQTCYSEGFG